MEKTINTFQKMILDIAPNKMEASMYYHSELLSPVTIGKNTTGSVTNEKGESVVLKIPNVLNFNNVFYWGYDDPNEVIPQQFINSSIGQVVYTDTTLQSEPNIVNPKIIGHSSVNEYVVFFTKAGDEFFVPNNQIWLWNTKTNQIVLTYHRNLNLNQEQPIRKAFTRYENSELINVYFTDGISFFKKFNVIDNINLPVTNLNVVSELNYSNININVSEGGTLNSGIYKYAYSLVSKEGKESKLSPLSESYVISNNDFGSEEGTNKQVEIIINNIPSNFARIKLYRIHQVNLNEEPVISRLVYSNTGGSFSYVDNNPKVQFNLSTEEILFLGTDPFICKDFSIKDNVLFPVNIKYNEFDVDNYDARAYAFNTNRLAVVTNITNQDFQIDASTNNPDYSVVPKTFDTINPSLYIDTNVDLRKTLIANPLYKLYRYQSDGTTLGVEGPNIKIKFVTKNLLADTNALGSGASQSVNLTIDSYNNPVNQKVKSLKRDEVYRFGIRFINKYGQRSFAKWVADIRVPDALDIPVVIEEDGQLKLVSVGIESTIKNFPNDPDIIGYEILRTDRTDENKTVLASGFLNPTMRSPFNEANTNSSLYANNMLQPLPNVQPFISGPGLLSTNLNHQGVNYVNGTTINYTGNVDDRARFNSLILQFFSPEFEEKSDFVKNGYFKITHGHEFEQGASYRFDTSRKMPPDAGESFTHPSLRYTVFTQMYVGYIPLNFRGRVVTRRFAKQINAFTEGRLNILGEAAFTVRKTNRIQPHNNNIGLQLFRNDNLYYDAENEITFRAHNQNALTFTAGYENDVNNGPFEDFLYKNQNEYIFDKITNLSDWDKAVLPMADYKRSVANQYGGQTFASKAATQYLPVGSFISTNNLTKQIFEGDVFVNWWVFQKSEAFDIVNSPIPEKNRRFKEIVILPIESSVNQDLRTDNPRTTNKIQDIKSLFSDYNYQSKYSSTIKFDFAQSKPFDFVSINDFKERVLASDIKINNQDIDAWMTFRINNYLDLNFNFGPINGIVEYKDNLFTFQNEGISILQINPKVILSSQTGVEVQIGSGKLLDNYKYLTTTSGSKHQFSLLKSTAGLFYYDDNQKKIMVVSDSDFNISEATGVSSFVRNLNIINDNPYINQGVSFGSDPYLNRLYFTFLNGDTKHTIVYSDAIKSFIMFHPTNKPQYFISENYPYTITQDLTSVVKMYTGDYNFINNQYHSSIITFVVNDKPNFSKVLELLEFNSKVKQNDNDFFLETITHIRVYNDYQDTGVLPITEAKRRFREWRVIPPRVNRHKIRSQYFFIELHYNNNENKEFILEDVITNYTLYPGSFI